MEEKRNSAFPEKSLNYRPENYFTSQDSHENVTFPTLEKNVSQPEASDYPALAAGWLVTQVVPGLEVFPLLSVTATSERSTLPLWSTTKATKHDSWPALTRAPENKDELSLTKVASSHMPELERKNKQTKKTPTKRNNKTTSPSFVSLYRKYFMGIYNMYSFF